MQENKRKVTKKQLLLLLEELETKPALSHDVILTEEHNMYDEDWTIIVNKLNAVPNGAKRTIPKWKDVLKYWKLTVKNNKNSDAHKDGQQPLDDLGKRLLKLVETEELRMKRDINKLTKVPDTDESHVFRRPTLRVLGKKRPRLVITGLGQGSLLTQNKRSKSLKTIYGSNTDRENNPEQCVMTMQLDRLHHVSQQLENHIKQVQDRIQRIKDMWQHDCADENI